MKNIISENVFVYLLDLLPSPKSKNFGRPKCKKEALLRGLIKVLKYDIPWNDLDIIGASGISCWRYFNEIQRRGLLKLVFHSLVDEHLDIEIAPLQLLSTLKKVWDLVVNIKNMELRFLY